MNFFKKFSEKVTVYKMSFEKNDFGEKVKIFSLLSENIDAIIKRNFEWFSSFSWKQKISHIIKVPFFLDLNQWDLIIDKNNNRFNIIFIEEKILLNKEKSYKKIYSIKE